MTIQQIRLDRIEHNPWQTRSVQPDPEYIAELADDIEQRGLLQIPIGRISRNGKSMEDPETRIQLAFGHNRLAAYIHLASNHPGGGVNSPWARMPVDIRTLGDEEMADMAWAENERRRDHTPIDRALAIQKRMECFDWSQAQVAEHLGISRPAVSNALRLLKLPEEYQDKLRSGEISERQAMALLPLFDYPEEILKKAEENWSPAYRPSSILDDVAEGLSSTEIRARVSSIATRYGENLHDAPFSLDEEFEEIPGIKSATCRDCEARMKERNLCTDPECFRKKVSAFEQAYLEKASEASGIQPLEANLTQFDVSRFYGWSEQKHLRALRESGCENLRLYYSSYSLDEKKSLAELGFPKAEFVCVKKSGYCHCMKGLLYQDSATGANGDQPDDYDLEDPPTAEDLRELARQARSEKLQAGRAAKDIVRLAGESIAQALIDQNLHVWKLLGKQIHYKMGPSYNEMTDFDKYIRVIAEYLAENELPYSKDNVQAVLDRVNSTLTACGLDPISLEEVTG
jgi:ParB/RepB/Spo0J family partition protein